MADQIRQPIDLNQSQINELERITHGGRDHFPEGYRMIHSWISHNPAAQHDGTAFWFEQASGINQDISLSATFIRRNTENGLELTGVAKNERLPMQVLSNLIAKRVTSGVLEHHQIEALPNLLAKDIRVALDVGHVKLGGWGGSFYYWDQAYTSDPSKGFDRNVNGSFHTVGQEILATGQKEFFLETTSKTLSDMLVEGDIHWKDVPQMGKTTFNAGLPAGLKMELSARTLEKTVERYEELGKDWSAHKLDEEGRRMEQAIPRPPSLRELRDELMDTLQEKLRHELSPEFPGAPFADNSSLGKEKLQESIARLDGVMSREQSMHIGNAYASSRANLSGEITDSTVQAAAHARPFSDPDRHNPPMHADPQSLLVADAFEDIAARAVPRGTTVIPTLSPPLDPPALRDFRHAAHLLNARYEMFRDALGEQGFHQDRPTLHEAPAVRGYSADQKDRLAAGFTAQVGIDRRYSFEIQNFRKDGDVLLATEHPRRLGASPLMLAIPEAQSLARSPEQHAAAWRAKELPQPRAVDTARTDPRSLAPEHPGHPDHPRNPMFEHARSALTDEYARWGIQKGAESLDRETLQVMIGARANQLDDVGAIRLHKPSPDSPGIGEHPKLAVYATPESPNQKFVPHMAVIESQTLQHALPVAQSAKQFTEVDKDMTQMIQTNRDLQAHANQHGVQGPTLGGPGGPGPGLGLGQGPGSSPGGPGL